MCHMSRSSQATIPRKRKRAFVSTEEAYREWSPMFLQRSPRKTIRHLNFLKEPSGLICMSKRSMRSPIESGSTEFQSISLKLAMTVPVSQYRCISFSKAGRKSSFCGWAIISRKLVGIPLARALLTAAAICRPSLKFAQPPVRTIVHKEYSNPSS